MSISLETLEAEVLSLAPAERSHLLDRLIASIESDAEIQQAWAEEARRRDAEIETGQVTLLAGPEVLARLRDELL